MKKWLGFVLKAAISVALVAYLATSFDLGDAANRIAAVDPVWMAAMVGVFVLQLVNNVVRWCVVASAIGAPLPFWTAFRILYIAMFLNQALPSTVGGDAARMFFARRAGVSLAGAVNGVMLERVVAVLGLILLVVITQPFLLARIGDNPAKYVFPALAAAGLIGVGVLMVLDRLPQNLTHWALVRGLAKLASDTKLLFLKPRPAMVAVALGVVGTGLIATTAYTLARALHLGVDLLDCLVLIPPVILVTTIPISIAGWGVREGAMVTAFAFIGMTQADAFVLSILFGLAYLVVALPGGAIWLSVGAGKLPTESETLN
jgi:uncharacterized membrane protein YbhN (UPF0104 family)